MTSAPDRVVDQANGLKRHFHQNGVGSIPSLRISFSVLIIYKGIEQSKREKLGKDKKLLNVNSQIESRYMRPKDQSKIVQDSKFCEPDNTLSSSPLQSDLLKLAINLLFQLNPNWRSSVKCMGQSRPLFCLFSSFSHHNFNNTN